MATVDFVADVTSGPEPLTVQLTEISDVHIDFRNWFISDVDGMYNQFSFLQNPIFTLNVPGVYSVTLTAYSDEVDFTFVVVKEGYITVIEVPFVADFSVVERYGVVPYTLTFTDETTGVPTAWSWDFENDGVEDSIQQNPSHTYNTIGYYDVKLIVTRPGDTDEIIKLDHIGVFSIPKAEFSFEIYENEDPLTVYFTDETVMATSWEWDFYNTGTIDSIEQNPSFRYAKAGTYTAKLTARNVAGEDSTTEIISLNIIPQITMANKAEPTLMQHAIYSKHSSSNDSDNEVIISVWSPDEDANLPSRHDMISFKSDDNIKTVHILPLENDVYYIGSETTRWTDTSTKQLNNDTTQAKTVQLHSGT